MRKFIVLFFVLSLCFVIFQYGTQEEVKPVNESHPLYITAPVIEKVAGRLTEKYRNIFPQFIKRAVTHTASLWLKSDGTPDEFENFCLDQFIADPVLKEKIFLKLSRALEILEGHFNKILLDLQEPVQLDEGDILPIDELLAGYDARTHLYSDFYSNKIAFIIALNFPYYSLEEKETFGSNWTPAEWAYARMGDLFISREPAEVLQNYSRVNSQADIYIADYNIYMGKLLTNKNERLFPPDMKLLSHWNLRDEIKSCYVQKENSLEKQRMIYEVMKRIITQEIPANAVNKNEFDWNPYQNKLYKNGKPVEFTSEPNTRYQLVLDTFRALKAYDEYNPPSMDTYIKRKFDGEMEISQPKVEALFIRFVSSPQVRKVAKLIQKRLKRNLEPFDIWYNGFAARPQIPENELDKLVSEKYPTASALEKDLPRILTTLGFSPEKTQFLSDRIVVDDARGSGHAWGPVMRAEKAHLRTRVPDTGMNYKGYNIAVHEFGHNVEQITSLNDVQYYMMQGIPNSAFTEALAFMFQKRDLELLGMKVDGKDADNLFALDTVWNLYEIMGVSLMDMNIWKWMYENPQADKKQLEEAVVRIAKDVWNKYYADVFGVKDQPIFAIYSHILTYPLYLSAYSYGYIIDFQIEQYIAGKDFALEVQRMFSQGKLTPDLWMKKAVGKELSVDPILEAADIALKNIKK